MNEAGAPNDHGHQRPSEAPFAGVACLSSCTECPAVGSNTASVAAGNPVETGHYHYSQAPAAFATAQPYSCDNNNGISNNHDANNLVQPHHWAYVDAGQLIQLQAESLTQAFYQPDPSANHCCSEQPLAPLQQQQQQHEEQPLVPLHQYNPQLQQQQQPLVFEGMSNLDWCLAPVTAKPSKAIKHNQVERRRRVRIKDCCELLKTIVPGLVAKTDKARVLEQTVRYLNHISACPSANLCECQVDKY